MNRIGSVVEWLKCRARDQHGLSSKTTHTILLCPWERHLTAHSPACLSWQAVLNYSHISVKLQADSNILAPPEAVGVIATLCISASIAFLRVRRINIETQYNKINKTISIYMPLWRTLQKQAKH